VLPPQPGQPASRLVIRGRWNAACGVRDLHLTPWHHEEYTLRAVGALWREAGGRLRGRVVPSLTRGTPAWPVAWPLGPDGQVQQPFSVHRSEPLPRLVREINKTSDNPAARNLMLSLAPGFPVRAATLPGARERVAAWLRRQGLAFGDIQVDSGSGLSRDEQGRPRALVHLLARAWRAPYRQAFVDSLPVAGVDGTLAHRLTRGQATGRAFMKTGTLNDTRALAGYVLGRSGNTYALAAIVNHAEAQRAVPMLDAIVEWVAASG
jgi:D-alanyl-D-alanine carboxypeptidase/D-alanyl-D-alanine-endopeptidase (penicillin-binding protein 4)